MSNLEQRVRDASMYKFTAQGEAYFPRMHTVVGSFERLQTQAGLLVEGTFIMMIDEITNKPRLVVHGFQLVECIVFEGEWVYLTAIKNSREMIDLLLIPSHIPPETEPTGISLSLICTDNQPYIGHLWNSVEHYQKILKGIDHEICVAFFADSPPMGTYPLPASMANDNVRIQYLPREKFHMAFARDKSLALCTKSHTLMIDLDAYLSRQQLDDLIAAIPQTNGVINFCKPTHPFKGNGLYFGEHAKLVANGHHQEFQGFYFEDTEFLMNLSRIGTVPWCYFVDFDFVDDHPRGTTRGWFPHNQKMFESILKKGHR